MKNEPKNDDITLNELAGMISKGFNDIQKQLDEIPGLKSGIAGLKSEVRTVKDIQQDMLEELTATHTDVRYLRSTVSNLIRNDVQQDERLDRVEKKVGLAK